MKWLLVFLTSIEFLCASDTETNLHISTWPSSAEVSLQHPLQPSADPLKTPQVFKISTDSALIQFFLFKPGYQNKAIQVRLKKVPHNYVFIHLSPETDSLLLNEQSEFLRERSHQVWSRRIAKISVLPFLCSGLFAWQAQQQYSQAEKKQSLADQSLLTESEHYQSLLDSYEHHVKQGDKARTNSLYALGGAIFMLSVSGILYF